MMFQVLQAAIMAVGLAIATYAIAYIPVWIAAAIVKLLVIRSNRLDQQLAGQLGACPHSNLGPATSFRDRRLLRRSLQHTMARTVLHSVLPNHRAWR